MTSEGPRVTLAIDTTVDRCVISLRAPGRDLLLHGWQADRRLDSTIFAALAQALSGAGLAIGDVDRVIVNRGPGSFIGTRIGLAVANTFATLLPLDVVGLDGFAVMARTVPEPRPERFFAALNCVRREVFFQGFEDRAAGPAPCGEREVLAFEAFLERVGAAPVLLRATGLAHTLSDAELAALGRRVPFDETAFHEALHEIGGAAALPEAPALAAPIYIKTETDAA